MSEHQEVLSEKDESEKSYKIDVRIWKKRFKNKSSYGVSGWARSRTTPFFHFLFYGRDVYRYGHGCDVCQVANPAVGFIGWEGVGYKEQARRWDRDSRPGLRGKGGLRKEEKEGVWVTRIRLAPGHNLRTSSSGNASCEFLYSSQTHCELSICTCLNFIDMQTFTFVFCKSVWCIKRIRKLRSLGISHVTCNCSIFLLHIIARFRFICAARDNSNDEDVPGRRWVRRRCVNNREDFRTTSEKWFDLKNLEFPNVSWKNETEF